MKIFAQAACIETEEGRSIYYAKFVGDLVKPMGGFKLNLVHAAIGVSGEAGELLDAIKKTWVYNKELDRANVIEELGDMRFYMQALMNELCITEEEVIQANVDKLSIRYKEGYTDAAAIARADKFTELQHNLNPKLVDGIMYAVKNTTHPEGLFVGGPFATREEADDFCNPARYEIVVKIKA